MTENVQSLNITYKGDLLGTLTFTGEEYIFEYSEKFQQLKVQPLPGVDHPISRSKFLWAYFQSRIPSYGSPLYRRLVESYELSVSDENNLMTMLATVGSTVATDPFIVERPA
jgi:hypothetical protein